MNYLIMKTQRIPNNSIYNIFITIVIAVLIIWIIYIFTSQSHYNLYIIEPIL
jgi:uncharacterized membrane protein YesL